MVTRFCRSVPAATPPGTPGAPLAACRAAAKLLAVPAMCLTTSAISVLGMSSRVVANSPPAPPELGLKSPRNAETAPARLPLARSMPILANLPSGAKTCARVSTKPTMPDPTALTSPPRIDPRDWLPPPLTPPPGILPAGFWPKLGARGAPRDTSSESNSWPTAVTLSAGRLPPEMPPAAALWLSGALPWALAKPISMPVPPLNMLAIGCPAGTICPERTVGRMFSA